MATFAVCAPEMLAKQAKRALITVGERAVSSLVRSMCRAMITMVFSNAQRRSKQPLHLARLYAPADLILVAEIVARSTHIMTSLPPMASLVTSLMTSLPPS